MTKNPTTSRKRPMRPKSVQLIKGTFSADDARHLLLSLVMYKIHFHELKGFGDMERLGRRDTHAEKRIAALKKSKRTLIGFLEAADTAGVRLRIDSLVKIHVVKQPPSVLRRESSAASKRR
jgi:hypothetical protein